MKSSFFDQGFSIVKCTQKLYFLTPCTEFLLYTISVKVLSLLEACFDLIPSPSPYMKIQIMGRKIAENLGFKSLLRKVKIIFLPFFSSYLKTPEESENEKKKRTKKIFDLPEQGFEPQIFSNFPSHGR